MFNHVDDHKVDVGELDDFVAANDSGGRNPSNYFVKRIIITVAILWSLFQIYYASPFPYILQEWVRAAGWTFNVVIDDTKARSIHLAFALFLAYLSYPALKTSPIHNIPILDWIFGFVAVFCACYYLFFYETLVNRSLGLPLVIIAVIFLLYNYFGQFFPSDWIISHRTGTLSHIINQQWITTEGVFGVALGVSTKYVFLFVLFGALLEKAGAGNYFIKTAFAYLGHMRGGPAKAAVVASGLTGLISGSSIANVVTTGTFTIPMMKRVGFSAEKAGAVEVASSVNGQIMPPVMGAAAFLMIEYINMPYNELILHAFLPALISYIALVYIVHLEACKLDLRGLPRTDPASPIYITLLKAIGTFLTICILYFIVKFGLGWIHDIAPQESLFIISAIVLVIYLLLIKRVASFDDLEVDDPNSKVVVLPSVKPTVNSGLHFLLPVVILIWCLMVERLSPGLSAFWGSMAMFFILVTQRPLLNFFRKGNNYAEAWKEGIHDLLSGLEIGAKNMIGIGIATATAGIIVGVVSLTGFGVQLSSIIEILSMGNILLMLILVAVFSLILGMGLPTTANYIVVSSLMAGVIVEVGRYNGLVVPLIAVHLFVFYFGIMADVTPPVGLASFAAAAVSGGKPIKTGIIAFAYSLRTALLPFLFIFNTDLLLIDVGVVKGIIVFVISTIAILCFTAASMGYFFHKNRLWETVLLLLISFALFRPGFFMEHMSPSTRHVAPTEFASEIAKAPVGEDLTLKVAGVNPYGKPIQFFTELKVPEGASGEERIKNLGLILLDTGEKIEVEGKKIDQILIDDAEIGSAAEKAGLSWDQTILYIALPRKDNVAKEWMFIPALLLLFGLAVLQKRRKKQKEEHEEK